MHWNRRDGALGLASVGGIGSCGLGRQAARADLYNCEGCEVVNERPATALPSVVRLGSPGQPGEPMILFGRVLAADGRTPAADVVV